MALPPSLQQLLARFHIPTHILRSTEVQVHIPEAHANACCSPSSGLQKVGSNPRQGVIVIHPSWWPPDTPQRQALVAHELFHEWQRTVIPDFDRRFDAAARETERMGLPPRANPYEAPAYAFEAAVRARLEAVA